MRRPPLRAVAARLAHRDRSVLISYPGLRMGNVLYFTLRAHVEQLAGRDFRVLDPDPDNTWAGAFPLLSNFLMRSNELRFTDRRVHLVPTFFQAFGADFAAEDLQRFISQVLLQSPLLTLSPAGGARNNDAISVAVNVRRGDYYDNPEFKAQFGFDLVSYIRAAVDEVEREAGRLDSVLVVSDGPDWCRQHLTWLRERTPLLRFEGPEAGIVGNFRSLAGSRRLILSNSTFSYWGAYVSNVLHGDNHRQVWAPSLHSRAVNGGQPWQHDPRWTKLPIRR